MLCGDMILQHNDVNTQSATKEARNTQSGTCEGSHLARSQSRPSNAIIHTILLLLLLLPHQNASGNSRRASELSSHSLFGTLAPSQPSRSHPRPLPARNSALLLISSPALLIGGFVFSWNRHEAAWVRVTCQCHQQSNKRAQDVYLYWSQPATASEGEHPPTGCDYSKICC